MSGKEFGIDAFILRNKKAVMNEIYYGNVAPEPLRRDNHIESCWFL